VLLGFVPRRKRFFDFHIPQRAWKLAFRVVSKVERLSNNQSSHDLVPVILIISIALPFEWVQHVGLREVLDERASLAAALDRLDVSM
jgi:hypothetical protein